MVTAGHHLNAYGLSVYIEAALLVGVTVLGCWLFFEFGRRIAPVRIWIGLTGPKAPALANT